MTAITILCQENHWKITANNFQENLVYVVIYCILSFILWLKKKIYRLHWIMTHSEVIFSQQIKYLILNGRKSFWLLFSYQFTVRMTAPIDYQWWQTAGTKIWFLKMNFRIYFTRFQFLKKRKKNKTKNKELSPGASCNFLLIKVMS